MKNLGLLDLLRPAGLPPAARIKLVRHRDARYDAQDLLRRGWLEAYQGFQSRPVFDNLDYVVSFVGMAGSRARLVGVFRVVGRGRSVDAGLPPGCHYSEWLQSAFHYRLERAPGFEHLENRVVIDWGRGALAWHQHASNKPVVEILPPGFLLEPFRDYLEFSVTFLELAHLVSHQEAHKEWRARLSAVAGVYLVLATTSGKQYVGSAHGSGGIWARWSEYAATGHGGNTILRELVEKDPAYPDAFTYSILQILPPTRAHAEVLRCERLLKNKLGTQATGLNAN